MDESRSIFLHLFPFGRIRSGRLSNWSNCPKSFFVALACHYTLASTRWVRSIFSSHCPISSKQRHLLMSKDSFSSEFFGGTLARKQYVPTIVLFCRLLKFIFKFEVHLPPCTRDNQYIIHGSHFLLYQPKSI